MNIQQANIQWDYMDYATQYYLLARTAASQYMYDVVGWTFHTAVEYYLKGGLVLYISPQKLKGNFGHNLSKLWQAFLARYDVKDHKVFLPELENLRPFSDIRYPDGKNPRSIAISISYGGGTPLADEVDRVSAKIYRINVESLDLFVIAILDSMNHKPSFYFSKYKDLFKSLFPPLPQPFWLDTSS